MKNIIHSFNGQSIRIIDINGSPWFIVREVCDVLGHSNNRDAIRNIDSLTLGTTEIENKRGQMRKTNIVNEAGLYELIFKSKKEEAKTFKRWVFNEVLPTLRKTGKYEIPKDIKEISKEKRKFLASQWQQHGVVGKEYGMLTLEEYRILGFSKDKRKPDMTKEEILTLSALEGLEALKLFKEEQELGFFGCRESLQDTGKLITEATTKKEIN
jgi:prophage antirepressor-like protein